MSTLSPQFKKHLATTLQVGTATAVAATVGISGMTSKGMEGDYQNGLTATENSKIMGKPVNSPTWNNHLGQQFSGFQDLRDKPASAIPNKVAVVHSDGHASKMGFDKMWDTNNDSERANNVWAVGAKW